jgi:hypothetical protein
MMLVIALAAAAPTLLAQNQPAERPPRVTEIPTEGFWPTDTMLDRIFDRISDEMADHYSFDDEQMMLTRQLLKERIPTWLKENRAEIQTLTNQFIEAQLYEQPPEVDGVASWSQRVLPLLDDFSDVVVGMTDEMRDYMTDDQQLQLEAELAGFETGVSMVSNKLGIWADGGYDPESEWLPPGKERRERERQEDREIDEAVEQAKREVLEGAEPPSELESLGYVDSSPKATSMPSRTSEPPDEWTQYTLDFVKRYQLNDEQQQKAMQFLRGAREQRDAYLRGKSEQLARVQALLVAAKDESERAAALEEFEELNAPVNRRLQQLKDRLNTLPTRAQRKAAANAEPPERADSATTQESPQPVEP